MSSVIESIRHWGRTEGGARPGFVVVTMGLGFSANGALMAAIPKLAEIDYGRGRGGLIAGTFMLATVSAQVTMTAVLRRSGPLGALRLAIVVLASAPNLYLVPSFGVAIVATMVRGVGFGILTVLGPLLTMYVAPAGASSRALGIYGFATSIGSVAAVPLGVVLVDDGNLGILLAFATTIALMGLLSSLGVGGGESDGRVDRVIAPFSSSILRRNSAILSCFFLSAAANANLVAFVAVLVPAYGPVALLIGGVCRSAGRYAIGPRVRREHLLLGVGITSMVGAAGYIAIPAFGTRPGVLAAVAVAGLSAGGVATLALISIVEPGRDGEWASSSMVWNVAFNSGMAAGAFAAAGVLTVSDYRAVFVANAVLAGGASVIALSCLSRRAHRSRRSR